jgi:hypothetical protein
VLSLPFPHSWRKSGHRFWFGISTWNPGVWV